MQVPEAQTEEGRTGDAGRSVADGLASTARVITAAAATMVVVFASFRLEDNREIKLFGLGLAVVFLDTTQVRMPLVPATMEPLGDRDWWLPRSLDPAVACPMSTSAPRRTTEANRVIPGCSTTRDHPISASCPRATGP